LGRGRSVPASYTKIYKLLEIKAGTKKGMKHVSVGRVRSDHPTRVLLSCNEPITLARKSNNYERKERRRQ